MFCKLLRCCHPRDTRVSLDRCPDLSDSSAEAGRRGNISGGGIIQLVRVFCQHSSWQSEIALALPHHCPIIRRVGECILHSPHHPHPPSYHQCKYGCLLNVCSYLPWDTTWRLPTKMWGTKKVNVLSTVFQEAEYPSGPTELPGSPFQGFRAILAEASKHRQPRPKIPSCLTFRDTLLRTKHPHDTYMSGKSLSRAF